MLITKITIEKETQQQQQNYYTKFPLARENYNSKNTVKFDLLCKAQAHTSTSHTYITLIVNYK